MRLTKALQGAATSSSPTYKAGLTYATSLVRRADHEAIYASYFYPAVARPAYLALRALNVELAGVPDQVSNQVVGRMRFQWWKDGLKGVFEVSLLPFTASFCPPLISDTVDGGAAADRGEDTR
jgi:phytoene/squalene synthetase